MVTGGPPELDDGAQSVPIDHRAAFGFEGSTYELKSLSQTPQ